MLSKWLTAQTINIVESVDDWKQAVRLSSVPLIEAGIILPDYIHAIYQLHERIGPYYVLAPGIAMPHARPEQGVNQLGLSLLVVKNGVKFNSVENDPIHMITLLAAPDDVSHIDMLTQLAELFSNTDDVQKIIDAKAVSQILSVIEHY